MCDQWFVPCSKPSARRCLLILNFDDDKTGEFLTSLDLFFLTMEITLSACTVVLGLLWLLSLQLHSFFLSMYQTVDLATPEVFTIYLIDFLVFTA